MVTRSCARQGRAAKQTNTNTAIFRTKIPTEHLQDIYPPAQCKLQFCLRLNRETESSNPPGIGNNRLHGDSAFRQPLACFPEVLTRKITCRPQPRPAHIPRAKAIRRYWKCADPQKVVGSRPLDRFSSRANRAFSCTFRARLSDFARLSHNRPGWKTATCRTSMRPRFLLPVHLVRCTTDILAHWVRRDLHQLNSAVRPSW